MCLIFVRLGGWLVLLGRSSASKDIEQAGLARMRCPRRASSLRTWSLALPDLGTARHVLGIIARRPGGA